MKTILILGILLALAGCSMHPDVIRPEFVQYMPAQETLDCETNALMQERSITTSKGNKVERRFITAAAISDVCGTEGSLSTTACTKVFTYSKAGSLDPAEQFWVIYIPWGNEERMRKLVEHELRHVYAGEYHD